MPRAQTKSLDIAYDEAGSGPNVLVFVHGNFASARWWRPIFDRLPPGFRAIAPVLRGCAGTTASAGAADFAITRLADDLHEFTAFLGLSRFHLVGHSLGAAVSMQYALDYPDRVRTLSLVSPAPASGLAGMREGDSRAARMLRMFDPDHAPSIHMLDVSFRMQRAFGTDRPMLRRIIGDLVPNVPEDDPASWSSSTTPRR